MIKTKEDSSDLKVNPNLDSEAQTDFVEKYIYGQGIVTDPEKCETRIVVTIERRLSNGWIAVEAEVPSGQLPQRFMVLPHSDLIPYGSDSHKQSKPEERINLNSCTESELLNACPGLGVCAHMLVSRKPKTQYSSIAQVKQLNTDLNIDWAGLQSKVVLK